jgi:hypothetical protein
MGFMGNSWLYAARSNTYTGMADDLKLGPLALYSVPHPIPTLETAVYQTAHFLTTSAASK